jgi:hypothetical protein
VSYSMVRKIEIADGKVFITSAESNTYPREYRREEWGALSRCLREKGMPALEKQILFDYWTGMLKGYSNKYKKAEAEFRRLHPEIKWNNTGPEIGVDRLGRNIMHTNDYVAGLLYKILKKEPPYGKKEEARSKH